VLSRGKNELRREFIQKYALEVKEIDYQGRERFIHNDE
jgi:hypothetical protein